MLFYRPIILFCRDRPGIERYRGFSKIYGDAVCPIDRSGVIKFPAKTTSLFPLPELRAINKTYEQICDERAHEIASRDGPLYVFWSGGIDSTCLLISLLKAGARDRITIFMNKSSVAEYPHFYNKYIRGKIRCQSSGVFDSILGGPETIINGEHNDQLFGSDVIGPAIEKYGFDTIMGPYNRDLFLFALQYLGRSLAVFYVDLFERLAGGAPVPLLSNFDRMWWINFTIKWQYVYLRLLSYAKRPLTADWARTKYLPFFGTEEFQLWSMNNIDSRVRDSWKSYKWPAKEVIYNFTKDTQYRDNKTKHGSLQFLIILRPGAYIIDDDFGFRYQVADEEIYEPNNDFASLV